MADNQIPVDPNDPNVGSVGAATLDPRYAEQAAIEYNKDLANQIRAFGQQSYGRLGQGGLIRTPGAFGVDITTSPGRSPLFSGAEAQFLDASSRQSAMQAQTALNKKRSEDYSNWMTGMAHDLTNPPTPGVGEEEMDGSGNWNMQNSVAMSQKYQQWYQKIRARIQQGQYMANLPGVSDAMAAANATVNAPDEVTPIPGTKMFRYRRAGQRGVGLLLSEPQMQSMGGMMVGHNLGENNQRVQGSENFPPQVVSPGQGTQQTQSNMLPQPNSTQVGGARLGWKEVGGTPGMYEVEQHPEMGFWVKDATAPNGMRNIKDEEATSIRTKPYFDYAHDNILNNQITKDYRSASIAFDSLARSTMGKAGAQAQLAAFEHLIQAGHLDPDFASSIYQKLQSWKSMVQPDGSLPAHVVQDMLTNGNVVLRAYGEHAHQLVETEANMAQQRGVPKKDADSLRKMIPQLPEELVPTTKQQPGVPKHTPAATPPVFPKSQQPSDTSGAPVPPVNPLDFLKKKGQ